MSYLVAFDLCDFDVPLVRGRLEHDRQPQLALLVGSDKVAEILLLAAELPALAVGAVQDGHRVPQAH